MGSRVTSHEPLEIIHVFMVSFPGQGHVNPLLRLAKRLADFGMFITLATPEIIGVSIRKANNLAAGNDDEDRFMAGMIRFEFFDDGWEVNDPKRSDLESYMAQLELVGRQKLPNMIRKHEEMGRPVSCIINNPFIPWVFDVAESLGIPSALFWIQSCACFSAYYHYGNNLIPFPSEEEPKIDVQLPHMPLLKYDEVPSFLHPSTPYLFLGKIVSGQCKKVTNGFCILMDTFQELEHDIIEHMSKISCPIKTIGPLFKGSNGSTSSESNSNIRADFFTVENNCIEWLDAKPPRTVVYISFGSVVYLKQEQIDEIAHGLMGSEISFLWVLRPPLTESDGQAHVLPGGFLEKVGERGKIVKWSPQEKVLAHPSTACFLTHCGWNSTMEALASGVSVVAFPQWGDQVTNAKFLVDVFKVGVRLCRGVVEGRVVTRDEVKRCLKAAIDSVEAVEMKENALKWKKAAEEAVAEGGSSFKNIQDFVDEVVRVGCNNGSGKKENSLEIPYPSGS